MMVWRGRSQDGVLHGPRPVFRGSSRPPPRESLAAPATPAQHTGPGSIGALGPDPKILRPGGRGRANPPGSWAARPGGGADFLEGERDINQGIKKKKFLHIFKTHVALSEVLFILTKSGGTCPHSGEADGTINHGRRCRPAALSPQLSLFCLFGFSWHGLRSTVNQSGPFFYSHIHQNDQWPSARCGHRSGGPCLSDRPAPPGS